MINLSEVLETNKMIQDENLDVRTITMGVSLLDCADSNLEACCANIYAKLLRWAGRLVRTGEEIGRLMASLEAEELSDIQPRDLDEGDTIADPAVYDTVRFILKDLESEGLVKCPCGEGPYDIRYCDGGVEAYCDKCGASYQFKAMSATMAEEYLSLDRLDLR